MSFVLAEKPRNYQPVPAGSHPAVCNAVIFLGVQNDTKYQPRAKVYLRWELPDQRTTWHDKNGVQHSGPMMIGKTYTKSLAPKSNLRADLESWRGRAFTDSELRGFDIRAILGKPCMLGIAHRDAGDKVYANITAVMGAPKDAAPEASSNLLAYHPDEHDPEVFALLPPWLQKKIDERIVTTEQKSSAAADPGSGTQNEADPDDEIPF